MKILQRNLKNICLSLSVLFFHINVYSLNIESKCSKSVTRYIQKLDNIKLFNKLISNETNLPCLIRFSLDYSLSDYKRWYVVMAMTKLAGKAILPHLELLKNDEHSSWVIRMAIAKSLSVISSNKANDLLNIMLDDRSMLVRTVVVDLISQNKNQSSFLFLLSAIDSKENFYKGKSMLIRKHIIDAIYNVGGKKAKKLLTAKLNDSDKEVALRAKKYLDILKNGSGEGT